MNLPQVRTQALALPLDERAQLANILLQSLDEALPEADFEQAWGNESARRAQQFDNGNSAAVSGEVVAQKAVALLR